MIFFKPNASYTLKMILEIEIAVWLKLELAHKKFIVG